MRICMVVNTFPTVSETFIITKVASLAERGHKVHVVCFKKIAQTKNIFAAYNIPTNNVRVSQLGLSGNFLPIMRNFLLNPTLLFNSMAFNASKFKRKYKYNYLVWFINRIRYDVISFEFSGLGVFFLPVLEQLKGSKVVSCRGTAENVKLVDDEERQQALRKLFRRVDLVHCVSKKMKQTIEPYCIDKNKIFINTPAVDTGTFQPTKKDINGEIFNIVSIGRLTFVKGHLIGLLALKSLVQKGLKVEWQIIGDGPDLEEIIFHINNLQLKNNVVLVGKRSHDEVNTILDTANALMLTSYSEGIPNVVLEAMSKEIPVVTTNCGGVAEVIDNGVDGFIVDLYDHLAMANKIEQLILNTELRNSIGKAARKKILEKFTLQHQAATFEKYFKSVL